MNQTTPDRSLWKNDTFLLGFVTSIDFSCCFLATYPIIQLGISFDLESAHLGFEPANPALGYPFDWPGRPHTVNNKVIDPFDRSVGEPAVRKLVEYVPARASLEKVGL